MRLFLLVLLSVLATPLVPICALILRFIASGTRRYGNGDEPIVLSYSQVLWDDVWQRPQEFAMHLGSRVCVVYCAPVQLHNLLTLKKRYSLIQAPEENVVVISPLIFSGHYKSQLIYNLNCWLIAGILRHALQGEYKIHCIVNTCFAEPVISRLFFEKGVRSHRLCRLVFDLIDDFAAFDWAPRYARKLETNLVRMSDILFTGTYELYETHRPSHPDSEFIPCGVNFEMFHGNQSEMPADIAGLKKPVVGYFGSISDRLDWDIITAVAREVSPVSVVLIGPVHLSAGALPKLSNLHYLGLKPHNELPAYAMQFDVGLIPFRVNDATRKLNPVKTLEYLSAGLPVVSTTLPDVERFFADVVSVARSKAEFVEAVRAALEKPDEEKRRRGIELARASSWGEMSDRMARKLLDENCFETAPSGIPAESKQGKS